MSKSGGISEIKWVSGDVVMNPPKNTHQQKIPNKILSDLKTCCCFYWGATATFVSFYGGV